MRIVLLGRSQILFRSMQLLEKCHEIVAVATGREAPEYTVGKSDFLNWANARGIPFSAEPSELRAFCSSVHADVAVSVNYPRVIGQDVIDLFPLGILNAHGGDLPRFRGNACQAWAIINGEHRIGLCIHRMISGEVDAGDILARDYLAINDDTYIGDCLAWMERETPRLFAEALDALERDPMFVLEPQSSDPNDALRCFPRRPDDGRINWWRPAHEAHRLVRASGRPFGGAFGYLDGSTIRVWRAELVEHSQPYIAQPGQIIFVQPDAIDVACGEAMDEKCSVALRISDFTVDGAVNARDTVFRSIRQRFE